MHPEGKAETVKALTVANLKKFHAECFVPGNMVVTVFGDIQPEAAIALVKAQFGGLASVQRKPAEAAPGSNAIPESKVVNKVTSKDTAMLMLAYACEGIHDQADHSAMIVLRAILNGYSTPGGWLHNELRGEGLVYFVQSTELTGPLPGYFVVASQTRPDKLDEVVQRIRRNLDRAKEGNISEDEFRTAIDQIVGLHAQENVTIGAGPHCGPRRALRPGLRLRQEVRRPDPGGHLGGRCPRGAEVLYEQRAGDDFAGEDGAEEVTKEVHFQSRPSGSLLRLSQWSLWMRTISSTRTPPRPRR